MGLGDKTVPKELMVMIRQQVRALLKKKKSQRKLRLKYIYHLKIQVVAPIVMTAT